MYWSGAHLQKMLTIRHCDFRLFAGDTCLISQNFNFSNLKSDMNEDLVKIHKWCLVNRVTIDPFKSSA